ncbi:hypothetical protein HII31_12023 [Pseudocercospora fuligena]|uniref:Uncharacterized protein n=1 Tax=Pseudocercospora fuligena TaxID=685502 RepID=A0A8H6VFV7_9PEZI|nr:hypothetical protein HII31_12023 [Pseudocercospora fuligena]
MGLVKQGIKYGSLAYVAHEAGQAISSRRSPKPNEQQQPPAPAPVGYQQNCQYRDANGYLHQSWCSGACNSQCNGSPAQKM